MALQSRWRRLEAAVAELRAAPAASDSAVPDSVDAVLNAIYDLWEVWRQEAGLSFPEQDRTVAGSADGETAAALVFARGGKTHDLVEFGVPLGFGTQPFGSNSFGMGGWFWQPYTDPRPRYADRDRWYTARVEGQQVLDPILAACRWFEAQPEVARPNDD